MDRVIDVRIVVGEQGAGHWQRTPHPLETETGAPHRVALGRWPAPTLHATLEDTVNHTENDTEPATVQPESACMRPANIRAGMIFKTGAWIYKAGSNAMPSENKRFYWFKVYARRNGKVQAVGMIYLFADQVYEMRTDWNKPAKPKGAQS